MPDPADTPLTRAIEAGSWAETARHGRIGYEVAEVVLRAALPALAAEITEEADRCLHQGDVEWGLRRAAAYLRSWADTEAGQ